ncbi:DUF4279 domain-containing protein [Ornithinibacillus massiliensis]|uniref:DUF4279 domain-containing protein n=1 Tax=Ornithinibacillus massiliensis TaxID=1944633 RepID=A0ABS5MFZ0_9BACI|nr:DUF4279 domain-containing protein [Ornithinibacillus massiliensis]MBS3681249.1 DUF4279 domain-containing protein [Ornithinibacillus massiliensis]
MFKDTSIEIYFSLSSTEPEWDFPLSIVTERLGINPTETIKLGEWVNINNPNIKRQNTFTEWVYSTGIVETYDFEKLMKEVVHVFKDKVDIINELIREFQIEPKLKAVVYVEEGLSPGYVLELEVMQFALNICAEIEIDDYISGFVEDTDEE